jgi:hypothetical protein
MVCRAPIGRAPVDPTDDALGQLSRSTNLTFIWLSVAAGAQNVLVWRRSIWRELEFGFEYFATASTGFASSRFAAIGDPSIEHGWSIRRSDKRYS